MVTLSSNMVSTPVLSRTHALSFEKITQSLALIERVRCVSACVRVGWGHRARRGCAHLVASPQLPRRSMSVVESAVSHLPEQVRDESFRAVQTRGALEGWPRAVVCWTARAMDQRIVVCCFDPHCVGRQSAISSTFPRASRLAGWRDRAGSVGTRLGTPRRDEARTGPSNPARCALALVQARQPHGLWSDGHQTCRAGRPGQ